MTHDERSRGRIAQPGATASVLTAFASMAVCIAFGRFSLGLLLPDMRRSLDLSYSTMGALASLNLLGYLVGVAVIPFLARRTSHLRLAQAGILLATVGMLVTALPIATPLLLLAVLSTGLAGALGWISSASLGIEASSDHNRGLVLGVIGTANGVGIVVASGLAWSLSSDDGIDWRTVWVIQASAGAVAFLASLGVRSRSRTAQTVVHVNPVLTPAGAPATLHVAYACFGMGYAWFSTYFVASIQATSGRAGAESWLLVGLGSCLGALIFGALGDRRGHARTLVTSQVLAATSCLLMVVFGHSGLAAALAGLSFGSVLTAMATLVPSVVAQNVGVSATPAAFARLTLTFAVIQVLAPTSGGVLVDANGGKFTVLYLGSAAMFVLAALTFSRSVHTDRPHAAR